MINFEKKDYVRFQLQVTLFVFEERTVLLVPGNIHIYVTCYMKTCLPHNAKIKL